MTGTQKIKGPLQILFTVFILVQPFLDTIYLYSDEVTAALGFSPSTILRFALAGILLITLLLARRVPVKPKIAVGIYLGLIVLYFILHHLPGSFILIMKAATEYSYVSYRSFIYQLASGSPDFCHLLYRNFVECHFEAICLGFTHNVRNNYHQQSVLRFFGFLCNETVK